MLNFKRFLKEEAHAREWAPYCFITFTVDLTPPEDYEEKNDRKGIFFKQLTTELKELLPGVECESVSLPVISHFRHYLIPEFKILDSNIVSSQENFNKFKEGLVEVLLKLPGVEECELTDQSHWTMSGGKPIIRCNGVPNMLVCVDGVELIGPTSLHNIHKRVDCKQLTILDAGDVKSCVLGLLRIKRLEKLELVETGDNIDWVKIINRYLDSDRDVIECQEELLDNDLEDYARL